MMKQVPFRKTAALALAGVFLLAAAGCTAQSEVQETQEVQAAPAYIVATYGSDGANAASDVLVVEKDQLASLDGPFEGLFDHTEMVYVAGDLDLAAICDAAGLPAPTAGGTSSHTKLGTAVTMENGDLHFNQVYALFADGAGETGGDTASTSLADGIEAARTVAAVRLGEDAAGYDTFQSSSAVVYRSGSRVGTMGYTVYFYPRGASSAQGRVYDCVCVATFAPDSGSVCNQMNVTLDRAEPGTQVVEATDLVSLDQAGTYELRFAGTTDTGNTAWSYAAEAQTVTNQFDMTTSTRTWIFAPATPGNGDAWTEAPGVRMQNTSTSSLCGVDIQLWCATESNSEANDQNTLHTYEYFTYDS